MITPYYSKSGIVIYRGKAGEIVPQLSRNFGALVFDPPHSPQLEEIISKLRWIRPGGNVIALGPKSYSIIMPQAESEVIEMSELEPRLELGHPVARPLDAMRKVLSLTDGPILDPYMGIGSTLLAAKLLGREATGIEIEEKYCRTAVARLEAVE